MKKVQVISIIILVITLLIMGVNILIRPLSDWAVRIDGIVMIIGIAAAAFSTVKRMRE